MTLGIEHRIIGDNLFITSSPPPILCAFYYIEKNILFIDDIEHLLFLNNVKVELFV